MLDQETRTQEINKMTNILIERLSNAPKIPFFELFDKKNASKKATALFLEPYQANWKKKKGHNRGGIVSSTYDVMHAILGCLAPTMEDLKKNQVELYAQTVLSDEYFVFISKGTLSAKINGGKKYKFTRLSNRTILNQIKRLLETGFLIKKVNYSIRLDDTTKQLTNPYPENKNDNGSGRIQLFINPKVFEVQRKFKAKFEELKAYYRNTFPTDSSLPFLNTKLNKEKIDSEADCGKVALSTDNNTGQQKNNEQVGQLVQKNKKIAPQFKQLPPKKQEFPPSTGKRLMKLSERWKKRHIDQHKEELLKLCCHLFFPDRQFTKSILDNTRAAIADKIELVEEHVREYRKKEVDSYAQRPVYQNAKPKKQAWMLKNYREKLPSLLLSPLEILTNALQTQYNHAHKNGYYQKIQRRGNDPVQFLSSSNFEHAIACTIGVWTKQNQNFFANNKSYKAYLDERKKITGVYRSILLETFENGLTSGFVYAVRLFKSFEQKVVNSELSDSFKKSLITALTERIKPLYAKIPAKDKAHLYACAIANPRY